MSVRRPVAPVRVERRASVRVAQRDVQVLVALCHCVADLRLPLPRLSKSGGSDRRRAERRHRLRRLGRRQRRQTSSIEMAGRRESCGIRWHGVAGILSSLSCQPYQSGPVLYGNGTPSVTTLHISTGTGSARGGQALSPFYFLTI